MIWMVKNGLLLKGGNKKMPMRRDDECYYMSLSVVDRISELAIERCGNYGRFSKAMGWSFPRWTVCVNNARSIKLGTLIRIAKFLDVSVEYLLTGKNKDSYKDEKLSIQNLGLLKIKNAPNTIYSLQTFIRKSKIRDLSVYSVFVFEKVTRKNAIKLLRGIA